MLVATRFACKILLILSSTSLVELFTCDTIDIMSSKPTRTRKAADKDPTSLALPAFLPFIKPSQLHAKLCMNAHIIAIV
jgi:hypothetical protein